MTSLKTALRSVALASAAAVALAATPAAAATIIVTYGSTMAIPANNNYKVQLGAAGLTDYATTGVTLSLSGPAKITFDFMGSESGFFDTFTFFADTTTGANSLTETSGNTITWGPVLIGAGNFETGGDLLGKLRFTSDRGVTADIGDDGFGVLLPGGAVSGQGYTTLFLGYDDQRSLTTPPDDNHDDYIVRLTVTPIPEPATWAMLIGGFALVGAAIRRRSQIKVALA